MGDSQYLENVMPQMWQMLSAIQALGWTGRLKLLMALNMWFGSAEEGQRERSV